MANADLFLLSASHTYNSTGYDQLAMWNSTGLFIFPHLGETDSISASAPFRGHILAAPMAPGTGPHGRRGLWICSRRTSTNETRYRAINPSGPSGGQVSTSLLGTLRIRDSSTIDVVLYNNNNTLAFRYLFPGTQIL